MSHNIRLCSDFGNFDNNDYQSIEVSGTVVTVDQLEDLLERFVVATGFHVNVNLSYQGENS